MASKRSMFKGAFGLDDWVWWLTIGGVALLLLLLLVCCCVCMQRAKRKGHEEALASVQARRRLTQERERAEQQQQQLQQQRYQQAQQPRDVTFANNHGFANGHQPSYGYSKQVTTAPLPKRKKNLGPQVAANGFREHSSHTRQFAKPYPGQQEGQATGQQYQEPRKWYNAESRNARDTHTSSQYPDNIRFNDLNPRGGGGTDEVPFMSVKSPSMAKANRKSKVRWQNQTPYSRETKSSMPAPVAMPTHTHTPANPLDTRSSTGLESGTSRSTLQSRIEALRSADTNDTVHSRISVGPTNVPYSLAQPGNALDTSAMSRALKAQDSYASGPERRSGMVASNIVSTNSSALANSFFSSPSSSLLSGDSYETLDREGENTKSMVLGNALTHGSSRSIGSDYSNDQFEDTGSCGPCSSDSERQNSSASSGRPTREDDVSYENRGSVEF